MAAKRRNKRPDELRREAQAESRDVGNEQGQDAPRGAGGKPVSAQRTEEGQRPGGGSRHNR
jgi:hypothetical protein